MERPSVLPETAITSGEVVNVPTAWCQVMGTGIAEKYCTSTVFAPAFSRPATVSR